MGGTRFDKVRNAYCRIFDNSNNELARYVLKEAGREAGLIIARLFREDQQRWGFQAIGSFSNGSMWKDSVRDMTALCQKNPRQLQLRGQSTMQFSGAEGTPAAAAAGSQSVPGG